MEIEIASKIMSGVICEGMQTPKLLNKEVEGNEYGDIGDIWIYNTMIKVVVVTWAIVDDWVKEKI